MLKISKEAVARWAQRAAGFTPSQAVNLTRVLTAGGIYGENGIGPWEGASSAIAICGSNISQAADAVLRFAPMRVKTCAGAPDPQPNLQLQEGTTLNRVIADFLVAGSQEILELNCQLIIISNPAEAQISLGLGEGRRIYTFGGPATDRFASSAIRTAKIVPAHVLAELADLLHKGESVEVRRGKTEKSRTIIHA